MKIFEEPEIILLRFTTEDIITTSNDGVYDENELPIH